MKEIDFKALQDKISEELAENGGSSEGSRYPTLYPGVNGKLTMKLLYNFKSSSVQRKIVRHKQVPCLQYYGENCPICDAINDIKTIKGKDAGDAAFREYGYKTRGICYAQIIEHDKAYLTEEKDPKDKDVVLFMYPRTVYDHINKVMQDAAEHNMLASLLQNNKGTPIVVERSSARDIKAGLFPYGEVESCKTDAEFEAMVDELPNLNEAVIPSTPTEEIREKNKAMAEAIRQQYLNDNIVNPGEGEKSVAPEEPSEDEKKVEAIQNAIKKEESAIPGPESVSIEDVPFVPDSASTEGKPACFGNHKDCNECLVCVYEADCI